MKDNILITGASSGIGHNIYTELSPMKRIFTIGRSGLEGAKDHFLCDVTQDPLPDLTAYTQMAVTGKSEGKQHLERLRITLMAE